MRNWIILGVFWTSLVLDAEEVSPWEAMDYGQWLASSVTLPWSKNGEDLDGIVLKGITFRTGNQAATFDTGELRWAAATIPGHLQLMGTPFDGTHRPPEKSRPALSGIPVVATSHGPGWAIDGDWRDLRTEPYVPISRDRAHYLGIIRANGMGVIHYSVGGTTVFEAPSFGSSGRIPFFGRNLSIGTHTNRLALWVAEDRLEFRDHEAFDGRYPALGSASAYLGRIAAAVDPLPSGSQWKVVNGTRLVLELPPSTTPISISVMIGRATREDRVQWHPTPDAAVLRTVATLGAAPRPAAAKVSWSPRFPDRVSAPGKRGTASSGYIVDTLPMPVPNPWHSWMRPSGFDFFADGKSAAVATWSGDVWLVTGLADSLDQVAWRRIAAGLFQPLGLKIVGDKIYVLCRDEIARLDDFDGDGEPDAIVNFNNDVSVTPNFHEFALDLQADSRGNFYFTKGGPLLGTEFWDPIGAHNGCVVRVLADGSRLDRYATGLRAPNGSGLSPRDELVCSDNEGIWTPVCRLNWVREGGFYGALGLDHRDIPPTLPDAPLCWIPYAIDNSSGSQAWAHPAFGPLGGELIHLSYGRSRAFHVLTQNVGGIMQGGITPLPWRFESSAMRGRTHPNDGSFWVAGLKGWQTSAALDGALHRIRWAGGSYPALMGVEVRADGFSLRFSEELDPSSATDSGNWDIQWWNYHWGHQYGSDLYSVANPETMTGKKGELRGDSVPVLSAIIGDTHRVIFLRTGPLKPVMQVAIRGAVNALGQKLAVEYYGTINAVP